MNGGVALEIGCGACRTNIGSGIMDGGRSTPRLYSQAGVRSVVFRAINVEIVLRRCRPDADAAGVEIDMHGVPSGRELHGVIRKLPTLQIERITAIPTEEPEFITGKAMR